MARSFTATVKISTTVFPSFLHSLRDPFLTSRYTYCTAPIRSQRFLVMPLQGSHIRDQRHRVWPIDSVARQLSQALVVAVVAFLNTDIIETISISSAPLYHDHRQQYYQARWCVSRLIAPVDAASCESGDRILIYRPGPHVLFKVQSWKNIGRYYFWPTGTTSNLSTTPCMKTDFYSHSINMAKVTNHTFVNTKISVL